MPRGAAEGDGWLIGPFLDTRRQAAGLNVFEASRVSDGPLWQRHSPLPRAARAARHLHAGMTRSAA